MVFINIRGINASSLKEGAKARHTQKGREWYRMWGGGWEVVSNVSLCCSAISYVTNIEWRYSNNVMSFVYGFFLSSLFPPFIINQSVERYLKCTTRHNMEWLSLWCIPSSQSTQSGCSDVWIFFREQAYSIHHVTRQFMHRIRNGRERERERANTNRTENDDGENKLVLFLNMLETWKCQTHLFWYSVNLNLDDANVACEREWATTIHHQICWFCHISKQLHIEDSTNRELVGSLTGAREEKNVQRFGCVHISILNDMNE